MITISFANQKGGVGKTTSAVTIGHALARQNHDVLLIDCDPQGHVAISLGLDKSPGLYRWLVAEDDLTDIIKTPRPHLHIVPGDKRTENANRYLTSLNYREAVLQSALRRIEHQVDICLIDLAPSLSVLHVAALMASDWLVIPTKLDHLALDGVGEVLRSMQEINNNGGNIQGYSILPTFFDRTTNETRIQMVELAKLFGAAVLPPVPSDTKAREAAANGLTLWEYSPTTSPSLTGYQQDATATIGGYMQIIDRLCRLWELRS